MRINEAQIESTQVLKEKKTNSPVTKLAFTVRTLKSTVKTESKAFFVYCLHSYFLCGINSGTE